MCAHATSRLGRPKYALLYIHPHIDTHMLTCAGHVDTSLRDLSSAQAFGTFVLPVVEGARGVDEDTARAQCPPSTAQETKLGLYHPGPG